MSRKNYKIYAPGGEGWSIVSWTSFADGEQKVRLGKWRREYENGNHVGYRPMDTSGCDSPLPAPKACGQISAREMRMNAGCFGRSATAGLDERHPLGELRRTSRVNIFTGASLAPEDEIERAVEKVRLWPRSVNFATGDKAVRAYPRG